MHACGNWPIRILTLLAVFMAVPATAFGAVFQVPGNFATIQAAITGAPDGSTILVGPGVYREFIESRNLNKNLYLLATGGPAVTAIDGGGTASLLLVKTPTGDRLKNLTFDGFTFRNGLNGNDFSPVNIESARPTFLNCLFVDNLSVKLGGAVVIHGPEAGPSFVNCTFRNNRATVPGGTSGAVMVIGDLGQAYFKSCLFEGNSNATASGTSQSQGGALYFRDSGGVVQDCIFRSNSTDWAGGAIFVVTMFPDPANVVTIKGSRFEGNSSRARLAPFGPSEAGAIMAEGNVTVNIAGCRFTGNVAEWGAAVSSYRANLAIADSVFDGNLADGSNTYGSGGAISVNLDDAADADRREAVVSVSRTMIRNNTAPVGGGIYFQGDLAHGKPGNFSLSDVTIEGCLSTTANGGIGHGGGLFLSTAACSADRVYLLRNTAEGDGGAIAMVNGSSLSLSNSFLAGNTSASFNPAILNDGGALTQIDTTVAYNNGNPTATTRLLAATPPASFGGDAYLAYFLGSYAGGTQITPSIGPLPVLGSPGRTYAAGSVLAADTFTDTVFSLSTNPVRQATVVASANGLTDAWFRGSLPALPGVVEAEDFDNGGEKVAYHDLTAANEGGLAYRPASVDIAADMAPGSPRYVTRLQAGEWLEYSVTSTRPQLYDLWAGVASAVSDGMFSVFVDGQDVSGVVGVPNTGGEAVWGRILVQGQGIFLTRGPHLVRFVVVNGGFNLDSLDWATAATKSLLNLSASASSLTFGQGVTLAGALRGWPEGGSLGPLGNQQVTIEHRTTLEQTWTPLATVTTLPDGAFSSAHAPAAHTVYRVSWPGTNIGGVDYPASSATTSVLLQPLITAKLTGYRSRSGAFKVYLAGRRVKIAGAVQPNQYPGGVRLAVQQKVGTKWKPLKTYVRPLRIDGQYGYSWRPPKPGRYRILPAFAGDADTGAAQANYLKVLVKTP